MQDTYNDYGFLTRYGLYREGRNAGESYFFIGTVKILRKGQTDVDRFQIVSDIVGNLGPQFCSVGASLDYYEHLNELDPSERNELAETLRDVAAGRARVWDFQQETGWTKSLFRGNREWKTFIEDATALYEGNFETLPDLETEFSFLPAGSEDPIKFELNAPLPDYYLGSYRRTGPSRRKTLLPERVLVLVGRNGSGKSTLLTNLSHVAFANPEERTRKKIRDKGQLAPNGIGFLRVITISYSAFDSFEVPGLNADSDYAQTASDIAKGEGRFVYCGLRDIAAEAKLDYEKQQASREQGPTDKRGEPGDRRTTTMLKSIDQLADEFIRLLAKINSSDPKRALLLAALEPLAFDPSFEGTDFEYDLHPSRASKTFSDWSTGHKIALHVIVSLVAHASRNALVLFDEPEMHLHPPLTAALMHSVRIVLTEVNAYCVVATHSPVVLQETLARHVRYVERLEDLIEIRKPIKETFGENVGLLTYDAFNLTASSTDFHKVLDLLVDGSEGIEEIEPIFTNGLSSQARAYVMSKFAKGRRSS
ncbi:AAA family ATPase [Rhizobium sp. L245/93]|uniref:AAA family ATPase n=1 Tax=Rhizobium sp. L245/93 TaxID=2819998 RepID=UPI001FFE071F|nr:AAA family ATPase [Rhizobium sp. L245/93]